MFNGDVKRTHTRQKVIPEGKWRRAPQIRIGMPLRIIGRVCGALPRHPPGSTTPTGLLITNWYVLAPLMSSAFGDKPKPLVASASRNRAEADGRGCAAAPRYFISQAGMPVLPWGWDAVTA